MQKTVVGSAGASPTRGGLTGLLLPHGGGLWASAVRTAAPLEHHNRTGRVILRKAFYLIAIGEVGGAGLMLVS